MKFISAGFLCLLAFSVFAEDVPVVNCAKEAQQITMNDIMTTVSERGLFGGKPVKMEIMRKSGIKNQIYLSDLDLDEEMVTYKTSIVAKVTNNFYSTYQVSECSIDFFIDGCEAKLISCSSTQLD